MKKALMVYATKDGETRRIAELIAEGLRFEGVEVVFLCRSGTCCVTIAPGALRAQCVPPLPLLLEHPPVPRLWGPKDRSHAHPVHAHTPNRIP